jgi:hypothetical protein
MKIDRERVELAIAADQKARENDPRYRLKQWVKTFIPNAVLYLIVLPLILGDREIYHLSSPTLWIWLTATVLTTAGGIAHSDWLYRKTIRNVAHGMRAVQKDIDRLTGEGWVRRTLLMGVYMGLGVGVPIGILMALFLPSDYGSALERWIGAAVFVALTLAWTIPMAFLIRWASIRMAQRYEAS